MKHSLCSRMLALLLMLAMLLSVLPAAALAVEASTKLVAWEYNDTTTAAIEVPATLGSGSLSHSTGDAISANSTGYFSHNKWSTSSYWLL